jgi:primosomal protein N' (replication factor Y) (superfamily II helicase)
MLASDEPLKLVKPLPSTLTYQIPNDISLFRGDRVEVSLGRRAAKGVVLGPAETPATKMTLKPVRLKLDSQCLPEPYLQWLEWLAKYYIHPIGQVMSLAYPPLERATKRNQQRKKNVIPEDILAQSELKSAMPLRSAPQLTEEQAKVIDAISNAPGFGTHLVHGVTGSGKTEIYIKLLEQVLSKGQQGILLVPEISLTPQLIDRFTARLGNSIAVMHSHLTPREKTNQWFAMLDGEKQILIGARSALFCPLKNLGMIILDEEHEGSYKQDEKLKYHARDAAIVLARYTNCPVLFGSATPSLETWYNSKILKKYHLHQLKKRVEDRPMPVIEVIDLKDEKERRKAAISDVPYWLSPQLATAIQEQLDRKEQSALFLNRRGVAQSFICPDCGYHFECPNCSIGLTLHGKTSLVCHYCDYSTTSPEFCPACSIGEPQPLGIGTEQVEKDINRVFPNARTLRMDRDEISNREDLEDAIKSIETGDIDILIGTQMIAKGLDFEKLTLVGVVLADVAMHLPDFRAGERAFQILTQVAGRSGRHQTDRPGRAIIQTYNPDHPSVQFTVAHDYETFAEQELLAREALKYPPFGRLAALKLQGLSEDRVIRMSKLLRVRAEALKIQRPGFFDIELLGPAPAPIARLRNKYRWHLLAKGPDALQLSSFCRSLAAHPDWVEHGVKVSIDIDALNLV